MSNQVDSASLASSPTGQTDTRDLLKQVEVWQGGASSKDWVALAQMEGGKALSTMLARLHQCAPFIFGTKATRTALTEEIRAILERVQNDAAFRKYCFDTCIASDADCADHVQAIFDELRLQMANPAHREEATSEEVVEFQRGRAACDLIDEYVAAQGGMDPLESAQCLKHALATDLSLPIQFNKNHSSEVFNEKYLNEVKSYVDNGLSKDGLTRSMLKDQICVAYFQKRYPVTFVAHNLLWNDAMNVVMDKASTGGRGQLTGSTHQDLAAEDLLQLAVDLPEWGDGQRYETLKLAADVEMLNDLTQRAQ
ncbi:NEL-type E3 ubiquitin ligase domain-containing protein [Variovorax saccharolyticus]|uniref:NEL-type E3 ubiquitin ligase domain-containing protein n=1 Tax=Variovorax saccharolyticus TaxID=3053516 RepID=UPI002578AA13|nr:NEL-type E3 ubiquitin ligase domain-containing protein [Variovorax sp. J31P216]MDM0030072.1 NEL-type E3 ubiquitin ligase domain-containing protein [Variovorax sp. J31P216]